MRSVNGDLLGGRGALAYRVVHRRASNSHRRLLVARQICDRRLIQTSSSIDVDGVGNIFGRFGVVDGRMNSLVLTSGCEKQTAIWSKCQTPEERCEGLVEVDWCIANTDCATEAVEAGGIRHDCR
jgi:hypothetical protein